MSITVERTSGTDWLDVGRAIAILGVVATHSAQVATVLAAHWGFESPAQISTVLSFGQYGVEFFFISGWLIALLYTDEMRIRQYSLRRLARIWPLWAAFCAYAVVEDRFMGIGPWTQAISAAHLHWVVAALLVLTFTSWTSRGLWNTAVPGGWSIQAEVVHYLLFPLIRRSKGSATALWMFGTTSVGAILPFVGSETSSQPVLRLFWHFGQAGFPATLAFFLIGVVSQWAMRGYRRGGWAEVRILLGFTGMSRWLYAASAMFFCAMPLPFGQPLPALGFLLLGLTIANLLPRGALHGGLAWVGKRSYFIYFCHFQVLFGIRWWSLRRVGDLPLFEPVAFLAIWATLFGLAVAASAVLAGVSFRWFEGPINRAAHRSTN